MRNRRFFERQCGAVSRFLETGKETDSLENFEIMGEEQLGLVRWRNMMLDIWRFGIGP